MTSPFGRKPGSAGDWTRGRNGPDELSWAAVGVGTVLVVVDMFVRASWLGWLALSFLAYACWRISSRRVEARRRENAAFRKAIEPVRRLFSRVEKDPKAAVREAREYRHLTCPGCGQRVRVPRGKGRLRVTCPKCGRKFEGRS